MLICSAKPGFFADGNRAPLYEVDISSGMLQNTDNGSPLAQVNITVFFMSSKLQVFLSKAMKNP